MIPSLQNTDNSNRYFLLEVGDIMEEGDEYYNPFTNEWLPVNDGEPECPECGSYDIDQFYDPDYSMNGESAFECNACNLIFTQPNYPDAFIGYGWDPQESKPVRRINPNYKPQS